ncbi:MULTISPECIES: outer membrane beta-barrel protein [Hydrogenophaga]|jgi:opacity protein-like surface antigen|uniref:Outer membrane protein beta-barrel domain-containing protein n=1 Tax=Hydrogenophaga intermedia TaxID=65786 RepID=A0A1L1Q0X2_HYDIT|nr:MULTISPECIES: outer membrane beta-barrel protein [Hydrogenophaga]AOS81489.1 hypothetical protein Q5W_22310 [Hydrogenophaga sp. PBC]TMU72161.1 porin family protein [Hydrogenophaga intermedia]CDN90471.1 hypothetical protein BN948_04915 [Hydrogenophaga intermedia]
MKIAPLAFVAAASLMALSAAQAQTTPPAANPKLYAEIGYVATDLKVTAGPDSLKASPGLVSGIFGYQPHPNFAVEGFLGFGAGKDKVQLNGAAVPVEVKLGTMVGVFARPSVALGETVELFGRIGWMHTELKTSAPGLSVTEKDSSVAYGIGANFNLSRTSYLQASWTSFYKKDDTKIEGFGLAYGLRF